MKKALDSWSMALDKLPEEWLELNSDYPLFNPHVHPQRLSDEAHGKTQTFQQIGLNSPVAEFTGGPYAPNPSLRRQQHIIQRGFRQGRLFRRYGNPVNHVAFSQIFQHPGQVLRVGAEHG